jgi:undecaprenyl-diphosphatase
VIVPLYALATVSLWLLARPGGSPRWKLASASALASAAVALLANQVASHLWERPRPFTAHAAATHLLAPASVDPSFPSDHAAAAFAIAFAVLAFSRPVGRALLAVAAVIALTRVALGVHYPSDVLAGALVGWASALLVTHSGRVPLEGLVRVAERLTDPVVGRIRLLAGGRGRGAA